MQTNMSKSRIMLDFAIKCNYFPAIELDILNVLSQLLDIHQTYESCIGQFLISFAVLYMS